MTIQAFIFDLDGVLTDTAEYHYRAWKALADELALPFTRAENEKLRGISRRESLQLLLKGRQYPEEQIQQMMRRKNELYLEFIHCVSPDDLLPGAANLLAEIRAAGLKSALGSASKNAPLVLERLGITSLLDVVADGSSVERQKPAPDLFLYVAAQLGLPPAECVVVEDAAAGIEAARLGGFRTIGLGPRERVGGAEVLCSSLAEVHLADWLKRLNSYSDKFNPVK